MKKNIKIWLSIAFTILIYSIVPVFADLAPLDPVPSNKLPADPLFVYLIISLSFIGIVLLVLLIRHKSVDDMPKNLYDNTDNKIDNKDLKRYKNE